MNKDSIIRITFLPQNKTAGFSRGVSILDAARQMDLAVPAFCGGVGICGRCRVRVTDAEFPPTAAELTVLTAEELAQGYRLACLTRVEQNCTVFLPQTLDPGADILSEGAIRQTTLSARVRTWPITCQAPMLTDTLSDVERLLQALPPQTRVATELYATLASALRDNNFTAHAVLAGDEVVDLTSSASPGIYGMAVDLGTTTVVSKIYDLISGKKLAVTGRLNSQRSYGEDVISRISYAGRGRKETLRLQQAVVDLLNDSIEEMCAQCNIPSRQIYEMVLAGNTVMQHLLLGVDAHYLAQMPYMPVFRQAQSRRAAAVGLSIHPAADIYVFPGIGRFVGGDTSAVLLSLADKQKGAWLAVDIGTNGEMILARDGTYWSTSAAAGPAFEGAHISQGMRAGIGAMDRVVLRDGKWHNHVIGDMAAVGICGSGLIDAVGVLLQNQAMDFAGRLQDTAVLPLIGKKEQGPAICLKGATGGEVYLTQKDLREVQLAKSAIATAIQILCNAAQVRADELDAIYLAGAFGQYIRKDMALAIGLLPNVAMEKIHFIGNAASVGAELALLSTSERRWIEEMAAAVQYVEVAGDPAFQDLFAENLLYPEAE